MVAQVTYSGAAARALHTAPLLAALALLLRGRRRRPRLGLQVIAYFASLVHAVLWPAVLGAAVAAATGATLILWQDCGVGPRLLAWYGVPQGAVCIVASRAGVQRSAITGSA